MPTRWPRLLLHVEIPRAGAVRAVAVAGLLAVSVLAASLLGGAGSAAADSPAPTEPPAVTHTERLQGPVPLALELPAGYVVTAEHDHILDVYHVDPTPPEPLHHEASLAVIVSRYRTPYCVPGSGRTVPAAFRAWQLRWHICREQGAKATVWETFVDFPARQRSVQIALIGTDRAELQRLRVIAESLRPAAE